MTMRCFIPFILAAVCSARVFRSMRELAHHHEKQQILARAYHQEKGLFVQFTRDKLAKDKKENKETIKNIVQSGQFCTQVFCPPHLLYLSASLSNSRAKQCRKFCCVPTSGEH